MITLRFVEHAGLFHRPGLFNRLCQFAQYGFPYTHCDAVMPDGRYLGARLFGGVQARDPGEDVGTVLREHFVDLRATDAQADAFYAFLRGQIGAPYDPIQIVYFFVGRNWQDPNAWSCSELIAAAKVACGLVSKKMADGFYGVTVQGLWLLAAPLTEAG